MQDTGSAQDIKEMGYADYEEYGRRNLQRFLEQARSSARHYEELAARHPVGSNSRKRNEKRAKSYRTSAQDLEQRLQDTARYLWRITISGYGEILWVGTPASAEGRRATKAVWEASVGRAHRERPARPQEQDGEQPRQEMLSAAS